MDSEIKAAFMGILFTVFLQIAGAIWWASDSNARLKGIEDWKDSMKELPITVAVMNQQMRTLVTQIGELNIQLERATNSFDSYAKEHPSNE